METTWPLELETSKLGIGLLRELLAMPRIFGDHSLSVIYDESSVRIDLNEDEPY